MRNILGRSLCAVTIAAAVALGGCNDNSQIPTNMGMPVAKSNYDNPVDKTINYLEREYGFELRMKTKDGVNLILNYTDESSLKLRVSNKNESFTFKDFTYGIDNDGFEVAVDNMTGTACRGFKPVFSKAKVCSKKFKRRKNKDFKRYLVSIKFLEHLKHWKDNHKKSKEPKGFNIYELVHGLGF